MGDYECKKTYTIDLVETRLSYRDRPPTMLPQLDINFIFSCNYKFSEWENTHGAKKSSHPILKARFSRRPLIDKVTTTRTLLEFSRYKYNETREAIDQALEKLLPHHENRVNLIEYALVKASEVVKSWKTGKNCDYNVLDLDFSVLIEHDHVYHNQYKRRRGPLNQTKYCCSNRTKRIKTMDMDSSGINNLEGCSICLEEYLSGSISSMECSHVFHTSCIAKWLRTSPSCPICRFDSQAD